MNDDKWGGFLSDRFWLRSWESGHSEPVEFVSNAQPHRSNVTIYDAASVASWQQATTLAQFWWNVRHAPLTVLPAPVSLCKDSSRS